MGTVPGCPLRGNDISSWFPALAGDKLHENDRKGTFVNGLSIKKRYDISLINIA